VDSFSNLYAKDLKTVISLLMPLILCFTVITSVALGVVAAYIAVFGILSTFGRPQRPEPAPTRPRLVLVPTQNQVSGD
jgi:hypothetical protein